MLLNWTSAIRGPRRSRQIRDQITLAVNKFRYVDEESDNEDDVLWAAEFSLLEYHFNTLDEANAAKASLRYFGRGVIKHVEIEHNLATTSMRAFYVVKAWLCEKKQTKAKLSLEDL